MDKENKKQYKENPADTAAGKWLGEQKQLAPKRKIFDRVLLVTLAVIIAAFGILIFALPSEDFSEEENRMLAPFPTFSIESLVSGEFTEGIAKFYSDRFPARNVFVGIKARFEKLLLRGENNGVIEGKDGYLIDRIEYTEAEYETLKTNLRAVNKFIEAMEKNGIPTDALVLPRSIDVMSSKLPALYRPDRSDAVWKTLNETSPDAITLTKMLRDRADNGEYVWYKTDHHYTTLGAYYVYVALGETLGYTPYPIEHFTTEDVAEKFLGTTYSSSGMKWAEGDVMTLFRFDGDENYTVSYPDSREENLKGFYATSYFSQKDKYSAFLGGNRARTRITLNTETDRPALLMIKDSFSHALAPFLALHFDIELIDLRYYNKSVSNLALEIKPDRTLVIYGIDTLATSSEARRIIMGVK
jgi:hypothetical protein